MCTCKALDLEENLPSDRAPSHLIANKRCQLPDCSFRMPRKGGVPYPKPKHFAETQKLVIIEALQAYAKPAVEGFKSILGFTWPVYFPTCISRIKNQITR